MACAHKQPAIPGAPDAGFSRRGKAAKGELPGDETIKNPEVAYNMALEFASQGNMEGAHHYIALASKLRTDSKYSYTNGLFYLSGGKYHEALDYLQLAMKQGPGTQENRLAVLNAMGACHMELGENEEALKLFRQVVNSNGLFSRYESYYNMGVIYMREKKYLDAEAVFLKVIDENPRYYKAYNKIGIIKSTENKWGDAATQFQEGPGSLERRLPGPAERWGRNLLSLRRSALPGKALPAGALRPAGSPEDSPGKQVRPERESYSRQDRRW